MLGILAPIQTSRDWGIRGVLVRESSRMFRPIAVSIALLCASSAALAQVEVVTFNANPLNPFDIMRFGLDVAPARDNGCVVVGNGDRGAGIVRFDAAGNVLWERTIGLDLLELGELAHAYGVQLTREVHYIISGGIWPNGVDRPCDHPQSILILVNDNGDVLWGHRYAGEGDWLTVDMFKPWPGTQVREMPDGGFVLATVLKGRDADCNPTCNGSAFAGVLVRTDAGGNPIFIKEYGAYGNEGKTRMAFTDLEIDGDYIVVMGTLSPDSACENNPNHEDTVLLITDFDGNVAASYALPVVSPSAPCYDPTIVQDIEWGAGLASSGGIAYIAADFPFQLRCADGLDTRSCVFRFDWRAGNVDWAYAISNVWVTYSSVRLASDGNLLIAGNDQGQENLIATAMKLDAASGNPLWQWHYIDPRGVPQPLNNIEGLAQGADPDRIWMVGTTAQHWGSTELYLIGTDADGKANCSHHEARIPMPRAEIAVRDPRIQVLRDLRDRRWEPKYDKPEPGVIDPCRR